MIIISYTVQHYTVNSYTAAQESTHMICNTCSVFTHRGSERMNTEYVIQMICLPYVCNINTEYMIQMICLPYVCHMFAICLPYVCMSVP